MRGSVRGSGWTAEAQIPRSRRLAEGDVVAGARGAWLALQPTGAEPERVEVLVRKKKSAVCRLLGPEAAGFPVIAKRTRRTTAALERAVHREFLPRLPVSGLAWRGMVPTDEECCWLFLEDAGENAFVPRSPEHRALASRWLARLHSASAVMDSVPGLPERGPEDALERLRLARARIVEGFGRSDPASGRKELEAILDHYDVIEARWCEVETRCRAVPRTLVHGDLVKKNMRIRCAGRHPELLVFDWEFAGFGFPGQDLKLADPGHYLPLVREHWPRLGEEELAGLFETGWLFRLLAEVEWATKSLRVRPAPAAVVFDGYASELERLIRARGWSA